MQLRACFVFLLAVSALTGLTFAQEGHPLVGTWSGDWGPTPTHRNQVTIVMADSRDGTLYAGIKHEHFGAKMHRSDDGGDSWNEIATPVYPAKSEGYVEQMPMEGMPAPWKLMQLWSLASGGQDEAASVSPSPGTTSRPNCR